MTTRAMLQLESALWDDQDGVYKQELMNELAQELKNLKQTLQLGVSPDEYKRLQLLVQSIEAASGVVERVWQKHNSLVMDG